MIAPNATNVLFHAKPAATATSANMDLTLSTIFAVVGIVIALLKLLVAVVQLWYTAMQVARAAHRVNDADRV